MVKFTWHGESDVKPFLEATPGLQLMTLEGPLAYWMSLSPVCASLWY